VAITRGVKGSGLNTAVNAFIISGLSGATTAGSCWVAQVTTKDTTLTVTGFTDDSTGGPMTFSQVGSYVTPTGVRVSLWATAANGGIAGASFIRANISAASRDAVLVATEWLGVPSIGINGSANNTTANPSIALTTQDANNFIVSAFGSIGATVPTALTGTLDKTQASDGATPIVGAIVSNTAATASSVTTAETLAATTWGALAVELRSTGGTASAAVAAMHLARMRSLR
jgi:hypothetical protein